jgi:hypothetical protein
MLNIKVGAVMLTQQHTTVATSGVAMIASLDAVTATQVIYSASGVAARKIGTVQYLQCSMSEIFIYLFIQDTTTLESASQLFFTKFFSLQLPPTKLKKIFLKHRR